MKEHQKCSTERGKGKELFTLTISLSFSTLPWRNVLLNPSAQ